MSAQVVTNSDVYDFAYCENFNDDQIKSEIGDVNYWLRIHAHYNSLSNMNETMARVVDAKRALLQELLRLQSLRTAA